ncbi:hypothetical protein PG994_004319 [Apiospora phragmitis]|uniref:Oxidoreductase acuF-like C2H2 type zinc-finger domain-containing protein n=1 Tax=Apiospora phragmitis TaxID=2905665 RepID=A0ABR1VQA0_9PEZI
METDNGGQLAKRVAQANVQRRQFIQYCRDHTAHLSTEAGPSDDRATETVSSKATTLPPAMELDALTAEEFDDDMDSLMTASTTFDNNTKLKLPPLNRLSPDGEAFQCPICSTIKQFDREKAWRAHAYQDLRAYSCTIGGKDCATTMFGDRKKLVRPRDHAAPLSLYLHFVQPAIPRQNRHDDAHQKLSWNTAARSAINAGRLRTDCSNSLQGLRLPVL